ncbi:hypothetical protein [Singulisphaera sp. PoT]|uniref:hypothetical protein n=1 Tax=Singulisphaera sp. PoT TaxID=3411797 RepID=UPI003BF5C202
MGFSETLAAVKDSVVEAAKVAADVAREAGKAIDDAVDFTKLEEIALESYTSHGMEGVVSALSTRTSEFIVDPTAARVVSVTLTLAKGLAKK